MRIPVPNNRLVALTLTGAVLTAIVAGALAAPITVLTQPGDQADRSMPTASDASQSVVADVPTPNPDFTPAVQTQSGYDEEEHEEYEHEAGDEEYEKEDGDEDEEYEEEGGDEAEDGEEHEADE